MVFRAKRFGDYLNRRPLKNIPAYGMCAYVCVPVCACLRVCVCVFKRYTLHAQPLRSWWRPNYLANIFGSNSERSTTTNSNCLGLVVKREYVNLSCVF